MLYFTKLRHFQFICKIIITNQYKIVNKTKATYTEFCTAILNLITKNCKVYGNNLTFYVKKNNLNLNSIFKDA